MAEAIKALPAKEEHVPKTTEEIRALLKRTHAGDESTVAVVRKMLQNPAYIPVFGGHLAEQVIDSFVTGIGGKNVGFREAVLRKLELMRAGLLGENPTPIERLLVERVVACWLQVQDAEMRAAHPRRFSSFSSRHFSTTSSVSYPVDDAHGTTMRSGVRAAALVDRWG